MYKKSLLIIAILNFIQGNVIDDAFPQLVTLKVLKEDFRNLSLKLSDCYKKIHSPYEKSINKFLLELNKTAAEFQNDRTLEHTSDQNVEKNFNKMIELLKEHPQSIKNSFEKSTLPVAMGLMDSTTTKIESHDNKIVSKLTKAEKKLAKNLQKHVKGYKKIRKDVADTIKNIVKTFKECKDKIKINF